MKEKILNEEELLFPEFMKNAVFGEQFLMKEPYYGVATYLESMVRRGHYTFRFAPVYVDPFRERISRGFITNFVPKSGKEILIDLEHGQEIIGKLNGTFNFQKMYELHAISVILSNHTDCLDRTEADVEIHGFFSYIRPEILGVLEKKSKLAKEFIARLPERERKSSFSRQDAEWKAFSSVDWKKELQNCGLDLSEYLTIF
jgi:hypothetical protein